MYKEKVKHVKCKSGLIGFQCKLQDNYDDFEQFEHYCEMYNVHKRLGYKYACTAWKANPTIQGSVIPSDFRKVKV